MKVFYVDVYFLINFTVDLLSLYIASCILKISIGMKRLVAVSVLLGAYAVFHALFLEGELLGFVLSFLVLIISIFLSCVKTAMKRKIKLLSMFLICETLLFGLVYLGYSLLAQYVDSGIFEGIESVNGKLLSLSLLLLFAIGVVRLVSVLFMNSTSIISVKTEIEYRGIKKTFDALVDSGNLARDPLDGTPVLFLSKDLFYSLVKISLDDLLCGRVEDYEMKKSIRIIPVRHQSVSKIYYGLSGLNVSVYKNNSYEQIKVIVTSDEEKKDFGGYPALMPYSAISDL